MNDPSKFRQRLNSSISKVYAGEIEKGFNELKTLLETALSEENNHQASLIALSIGTLKSNYEDHEDAIKYLNLAISHARKTDDKQLILKCLTHLANFVIQFDVKIAAEVYNEARSISRQLSDKKQYAINTVQYANCLPLENTDKILSLYKEGKEYFETTNNKKWVGIINFKIGIVLHHLSKHGEAKEYLLKSKEILQSFPEIYTNLRIQEVLKENQFLMYSGKSKDYFLYFPQRKKLSNTPGNQEIIKKLIRLSSFDSKKQLSKMNISNISNMNQQDIYNIVSKASEMPLDAPDIKEKASLTLEVAEDLVEKGDILNAYFLIVDATAFFVQAQEKRKVKKAFKKLRKIAKQNHKSEELELYALDFLGSFAVKQNPKKTLEFAKEAMNLAKKIGNRYYEAKQLLAIAEAQAQLNVDKSLGYYEQAISSFAMLEDQYDMLRTLVKYGKNLLPNNKNKGRVILKRAKNLAEEMQDIEMIKNIDNILSK